MHPRFPRPPNLNPRPILWLLGVCGLGFRVSCGSSFLGVDPLSRHGIKGDALEIGGLC